MSGPTWSVELSMTLDGRWAWVLRKSFALSDGKPWVSNAQHGTARTRRGALRKARAFRRMHDAMEASRETIELH